MDTDSQKRAGTDGPWMQDGMVLAGAVAMLAICVMVAATIAESSRGLVAMAADAVFWGGAALLYFAPALVALDQKHPGRKAIVALNVVVGWTGLGWLALLGFAFRPAAWSFSDPTGPAIPEPRKRCLNCRRTLGLEADTCFYCGAQQVDGSLSAR